MLGFTDTEDLRICRDESSSERRRDRGTIGGNAEARSYLSAQLPELIALVQVPDRSRIAGAQE
jgi:xanthine dehydrogenase iron-sulfur cluster and FAD-binding subunit A